MSDRSKAMQLRVFYTESIRFIAPLLGIPLGDPNTPGTFPSLYTPHPVLVQRHYANCSAPC